MPLTLLLTYKASIAQTDNIRIVIPGKSDLLYNGKSLQILDPNLAIGQDAGASLDGAATDNTLIGKTAGKNLISGRSNTFLGNNAGYKSKGSANVFIGNDAGYNEGGDEKLYISNSSTATPLIYGDFRTNEIAINDYLSVSKDLEVGGTGEMSGLTLSSTNPSLSFKSGTSTPFSITYGSSSQTLAIGEMGVTGSVFAIKNGEVSMSQYAGTGEEAIYADESGKLIRRPKVNQTLNKYNFFDPEDLVSGQAVRYRLGVQLPDGITVTGLNAFVLDNEPGSNTGIHNTPYISLERESKTNKAILSEEIFRVEGVNTAADVFTPITTTNDIGTGRDIIDNTNYIYYIEIFMCSECDFSEITILE